MVGCDHARASYWRVMLGGRLELLVWLGALVFLGTMFTTEQLGGIAEITTDAEAWAMAKAIAPRSALSLRALFVALSEPLEAEVPDTEPAAPSSSSAADTLPAAQRLAV